MFNAQEHQRRTFEAVNELNRHTNVRLIGTRAMSNPVVQLIAGLGLAGVMYVAIGRVNDGEMQIDEFMSFLTALLLVTAPLRAGAATTYRRSRAPPSFLTSHY